MNGKVLIANSDFLYNDVVHHGRLGQKWGERNGPPYPLNINKKQYSLLSKYGGKLAKGLDNEVDREAKKAKKKEERQRIKEDRERRRKEKRIKNVQKAKSKAISANSYQRLYDMKDKLTYQELSDAMSRIDLEQKIYAKANPKRKTFVDKMDDLMRGVDKTVDWTKTGIKAYNQMALLFNNSDAVREGKAEAWKYVEKDSGKKKDKKDD